MMVGMVTFSDVFSSYRAPNPANQGSKLYQEICGDISGDLRVICVSQRVGCCWGLC